MKAHSILIISIGSLAGALGFAGDDPPHDEPRTALMDFKTLDATLSVGAMDADHHLQPGVSGTIDYFNSGKKFQWNASVEVLRSTDDFTGSAVQYFETQARARWKLGGNKTAKPPTDEFEDEGTYWRSSLGVDAFYLTNSGLALIDAEDQPKGTVLTYALGRVHQKLYGAIIKIFNSSIQMHEEEETQLVDLSYGIGLGMTEVDAPGHGYEQSIRGIYHGRVELHLFDNTTGLSVDLTRFVSFGYGKSEASKWVMKGSYDIGPAQLSAGIVNIKSGFGESPVVIDGQTFKDFDITVEKLFLGIGVKIL